MATIYSNGDIEITFDTNAPQEFYEWFVEHLAGISIKGGSQWARWIAPEKPAQSSQGDTT